MFSCVSLGFGDTPTRPAAETGGARIVDGDDHDVLAGRACFQSCGTGIPACPGGRSSGSAARRQAPQRCPHARRRNRKPISTSTMSPCPDLMGYLFPSLGAGKRCRHIVLLRANQERRNLADRVTDRKTPESRRRATATCIDNCRLRRSPQPVTGSPRVLSGIVRSRPPTPRPLRQPRNGATDWRRRNP